MAGASSNGELTILCIGGIEPAEHVNRLYVAVTRHAWRPVRFLCLGREGDGLRPEIGHISSPDAPAPEGQGNWSLLGAFAPSIAKQLSDNVLILTSRVLVVGSMEAFFDLPGDFIMIRDWYHPHSGLGNASVLRFRPSRLTDAFEQYARDPVAVTSRFRNAREYLSWYVGQFSPLTFWPNGWCVSFRRDCIPPWPMNLWREPRSQVGSRIVVFHGEPGISGAIAGGPTTRGTRSHLPAPWVADRWCE